MRAASVAGIEAGDLYAFIGPGLTSLTQMQQEPGMKQMQKERR